LEYIIESARTGVYGDKFKKLIILKQTSVFFDKKKDGRVIVHNDANCLESLKKYYVNHDNYKRLKENKEIVTLSDVQADITHINVVLDLYL
jgi:hypothetical protein